ncbi:MAG TPA: BamA/TamA family outer membrane protein [Steroidobacter sp.]|nr:BamA/TamA family outer membrane protein [Steroidobacteraceae bacterium]HLS82245.1 BamA/TamA family outer membrane protein [Steroidobacter sp.]
MSASTALRVAAPLRRARVRAAALLASACAFCSMPATADIEIVIPDVSAAVENNVRTFLSLTRYADRDDVDVETMARLQRRIVNETREALQPLGYYEPDVSWRTEQNGSSWRVTIHIIPGRPVRLSQVEIDASGPGADHRPLRELLQAQVLKPGLRLNHGAYERVKSDLLRTARNEGYLDARFTRNELIIDRAERQANVHLHLDTGPRYSFGEISIAQDAIDEAPMRRMLRMRRGDPYTLDALLRTQYVLDDSLYFDNVAIESGELDRESLTVPVSITADPARKHRFATSLGYGTDTRVRGRFTWNNRRVNHAGHRFSMQLLGSSVVKELSARYAIPVMDVALEKLEFTASLSEEEFGDALSQRAQIGAGLTQTMGRWQRVLFLRALNETSTVGAEPSQTDFLLIPGISYSSLPSYVVGGRARPYFLYAELRGSPSTLGSDSSFLQIRAQGERIFDLGPLWTLRLRAEIGASRVADFSRLPVSQRFFAGGERSVRGFALNELSPKDETGASIGGENLAAGSIELTRALPRNFGVAAFYDIGNAFDSFADPQFEYSVGLGVRYNVAVASFGVDVAQALSESGRSPRVHLFISTQF